MNLREMQHVLNCLDVCFDVRCQYGRDLYGDGKELILRIYNDREDMKAMSDVHYTLSGDYLKLVKLNGSN